MFSFTVDPKFLDLRYCAMKALDTMVEYNAILPDRHKVCVNTGTAASGKTYALLLSCNRFVGKDLDDAINGPECF